MFSRGVAVLFRAGVNVSIKVDTLVYTTFR